MGGLLYCISVGVCVIGIFVCLSECGPLNDYILDYQPLIYDRSAVHRNHERVRRSTDSHFTLRFTAFGKQFHVKLWPSNGVFSPQHVAYIDGKGLHRPDTSFIYFGSLKGDSNSQVHLAVHNGSMEGEIRTSDTTYHIEPARKYVTDPAFHTIIYPETHLNTDPYSARRKACGVDHDHIHKFMEEASRLYEEPAKARNKRAAWEDVEHTAQDMYSKYVNRQKRSSSEPRSRQKRDLKDKTTCPMHVRSDPLLFSYFKSVKHGSTVSDERAENEIMAFFSSHVHAMSDIFKNTVFQTYDGDMKNVGLNFVIHRSTIMKDCNSVSKDYCRNTLDVSNYLEMVSTEDHDEFCLSFTFTYRDFSGGTLGLAWVATPSNPQAGVCAQYSRFSTARKTLNTGIVTIINFGKVVPNRVSQLTFTHEAGHNFGSPHDSGVECAPFGTSRSDANNGNYIMFPSATSGNRPNNARFSVCSRDNMTRIIEDVVNSVRTMCFIQSGQAYCGNQITEEGEECDCGFGQCAAATCCVGRDENVPNSGCRLKDSAVCSPNSGPCCETGCTLKAQGSFVCESATDCKEQAACNGVNFTCPEPVLKPNGTSCSDYSKVCVQGECIGSICQIVNNTQGMWEECFKTSETGQSSELCYVSCKNPVSGECVSSVNTEALNKSENSAFKALLLKLAQKKASSNASNLPLSVTLPPGSACDNFRGYCDTFSSCQRIDSQGPFDQLTNMIFDPVTLSKVREWIVEHWWAVLLICLGLVVFMGVFVKVCGYNTPSSDPSTQGRRQKYEDQPRPQPRPQQRPPPEAAQRAPSRPSASQEPPSYSFPPSYISGSQGSKYRGDMDMVHYPRPSRGQQFDRLAPKYGHKI